MCAPLMGEANPQRAFFYNISLETFVPADHPLRAIRMSKDRGALWGGEGLARAASLPPPRARSRSPRDVPDRLGAQSQTLGEADDPADPASMKAWSPPPHPRQRSATKPMPRGLRG